jgi:phage baseplate assembly protein W
MARGLGFYNSDWFKIKKEKDLIYENIIRILMTSKGERVMRPDFGVGLNRSLFELVTPDTLQDIAIMIHTEIDAYEDKVTVDDVQTELTDERDAIKIHVFFSRKDIPTNELNGTEELTLKYNL